MATCLRGCLSLGDCDAVEEVVDLVYRVWGLTDLTEILMDNCNLLLFVGTHEGYLRYGESPVEKEQI